MIIRVVTLWLVVRDITTITTGPPQITDQPSNYLPTIIHINILTNYNKCPNYLPTIIHIHLDIPTNYNTYPRLPTHYTTDLYLNILTNYLSTLPTGHPLQQNIYQNILINYSTSFKLATTIHLNPNNGGLLTLISPQTGRWYIGCRNK